MIPPSYESKDCPQLASDLIFFSLHLHELGILLPPIPCLPLFPWEGDRDCALQLQLLH